MYRDLRPVNGKTDAHKILMSSFRETEEKAFHPHLQGELLFMVGHRSLSQEVRVVGRLGCFVRIPFCWKLPGSSWRFWMVVDGAGRKSSL